MSTFAVNITNAGAANVSVSNGSTVNATVGNGGAVSVALGGVTPGNATVVSGTLTINSTTTLNAGAAAYAKNAGTIYAAKLDLGIPAGPATNVLVGNVTTLSAGQNATVTGSQDGTNLTLSFGIPAGRDGSNGTNGTTPTIQIGSVTTGAPGSTASVTATPANGGQLVTLNLTIPRGDPGSNGANGANGTNLTLSDATPSSLGTAAAGTSTLAARADHVHALPVIAYSNLSGVPANFPTNTTLVSGLSAGYSVINHQHPYVTALNNLTGSLTLAPGPNVTISTSNLTLTIDSVGGLGENDAVDGGDYVGEILGGITFSTQPQSVTASTTTGINFSSLTPSIPSGLSQLQFAGDAIATGNTLIAQYRDTFRAALLSSTDNGSSWSTLLDIHSSDGASTLSGISVATNGTRYLFTTGMDAANYVFPYGQRSPFSGVFASNAANLSDPQFVAEVRSRGVAYLPSAGRFATATEDGLIFTSSDGTSWTQRTRQHAFRPAGIHAVGTRFVIVPQAHYENFQFYGYWSTDGISWTAVNRTQSYGCTSSASNGSRIVAVTGLTTAYYTTDGATYAAVTLPVACERISYAAGLFWAFPADSTTDVCTSPDGIAWTLRDRPAASVGYSAASIDASNVVFMSTSGQAKARANITTSTASANFTVAATADGGQPVSYQWQSSLDAGVTWSNIANASSSTLALSGLLASANGTRYRASASATGAATVTSQSAILTVTG